MGAQALHAAHDAVAARLQPGQHHIAGIGHAHMAFEQAIAIDIGIQARKQARHPGVPGRRRLAGRQSVGAQHHGIGHVRSLLLAARVKDLCAAIDVIMGKCRPVAPHGFPRGQPGQG